MQQKFSILVSEKTKQKHGCPCFHLKLILSEFSISSCDIITVTQLLTHYSSTYIKCQHKILLAMYLFIVLKSSSFDTFLELSHFSI